MTVAQRLCLAALKYAPVVSAAAMLVHASLLVLGLHDGVTETVCGTALLPSLVLLATSHAFHFCWLHKAFIAYTLSVDMCCNYERDIGFGHFLPTVRLAVVFIGLLLFAILIRKSKCYAKTVEGCPREDSGGHRHGRVRRGPRRRGGRR